MAIKNKDSSTIGGNTPLRQRSWKNLVSILASWVDITIIVRPSSKEIKAVWLQDKNLLGKKER